MSKLSDLKSNVEAARKKYHDLNDKHLEAAKELADAHKEVKAAQVALAAYISDGAAPCPNCGNKTHGMLQYTAIKNTKMELFEVGCLSCHNHGAIGFTPKLAVQNWNDGVKVYSKNETPPTWIQPE